MYGEIAINALILCVLLVIFLQESIFEKTQIILAAVGIPSVISIFPRLFFDGLIGFLLSLVIFIGLFYYLLKILFDLAPGGAIKLIGMFLVCRFLVGIVLGIIVSA